MTEPDFLRTTRASYDAVAADYAERFRTELAIRPLDRAMIAAFAELVLAADAGPVADIGCGPGRVTGHLQALGLDVFGVDLSPEMVGLARQAHPGLRFREGSMTALDLPDGSLGGILAWYSIIHLPQEQLPQVLAEFHRVLAPGGQILLAFQVGDEPLYRTELFGREVSLHFYRRRSEEVAELLGRAGLVMHARLQREPDGAGVETTPQGYLLARKPAEAGGS